MAASIVIALFVLGCVIWLLWQFQAAPEGYEDQTGYHDGRPPAGTKLL